MKAKIIKQIIKEENKNALFIEGKFDKALVGTGKLGGKHISAVYDSTKCIEILIKEYKMDELEALNHFDFSIDSMKESNENPIFINDFRKTKELKKIDIDENKTLKDIL